MRRSLPGTVRTSQSRVSVPTSGWWMVLVSVSWTPTTPVSHRRAKSVLLRPEVLDQGAQAGIGRVAGPRRPEVGDHGRLEPALLLRGCALTRLGAAGEVAPDDVALASARADGSPNRAAHSGFHRIRFQAASCTLSGAPSSWSSSRSHPWRDVGRQLARGPVPLAGEQIQVLPLGRRQPQGAGQRGQDLRRTGRWPGPAPGARCSRPTGRRAAPVPRVATRRRAVLRRRAARPRRGRAVAPPRSALPSSVDPLMPPVSSRRARTAWYWQSTGRGGTACSYAADEGGGISDPPTVRSENMTTTLITGANKGLGYETARRLIEAGHTVYVGARDAERGQAAAARARRAASSSIDVTDDDSVEAAADVVREARGPPRRAGQQRRDRRRAQAGRRASTGADMLTTSTTRMSSASCASRTPSCRCCRPATPRSSSTSAAGWARWRRPPTRAASSPT